jgi:Ca2+-transporting ATPase
MLRETQVIARATPAHKLRVVRALAAAGEIVAMTGDGVNDAPALDAAHIGVAMGRRGTDVAREAADLVITDDHFASIVAGVALGRRVFDNLKKAIAYVFSVHVPIVGLALVPPLLGLPAMLLPLHIVFLELVIDPACSLAFEVEPEAKDLMRRPPRRVYARLMGRRSALFSVMLGTCVLVVTMGCLIAAVRFGFAYDVCRTFSFVALIGGTLALIHVHRRGATPGRGTNRTAWVLSFAACIAMLPLVVIAPVASVFHFAPVPLDLAGGAFLLGVSSVAWVEVWRALRRRVERGSCRGTPRAEAVA